MAKADIKLEDGIEGVERSALLRRIYDVYVKMAANAPAQAVTPVKTQAQTLFDSFNGVNPAAPAAQDQKLQDSYEFGDKSISLTRNPDGSVSYL